MAYVARDIAAKKLRCVFNFRCSRVRGGQAQCLASATELVLPAGENASFAHNNCASRPILKILTALESAYLVPKFANLSRYHITYMARGSTAKKLQYEFNFWWLKALG